MSLTTSGILTIIAATAGITTALVAPLYVLIIRYQGERSSTDTEVTHLTQDQDSIEESLADIEDKLVTLQQDVQANGDQVTVNQQHIHELLLGKIDADETEIGNPHYKAEYCPIPEQCTFHNHS
jgi:peptidoglycan hydrolase CwlO-like protein